MKRIKIFCLLFIFTCILVSFMGVSAEAFFIVNCEDTTVNKDGKLACDVMTMWMNESLASVSFDYDTDFSVMLVKENISTVNYANGKASITLEDFVQFAFEPVKIATMILDSNGISSDTADVTISNIKFLNSNNDETHVSDVVKTININQNYVKDSVCLLTSITVDGAPIQGFDENKFEYDNIYVNKSNVFLDATRKSDKSSVMGVGSTLIPENETVIKIIKVVAENGDSKEYKLHITNKDMPSSVLPDVSLDDNSLKSLELYANDNKIDFPFDSGKSVYVVAINNKSITKVNAKAELNSNTASFVDGYGPRDIDINYGDNAFEIRVKSSSGDIRSYTINISKEDTRNSDNLLSTLTINDIEVKILPTQLEYNVNLPHNIEETDIIAEANDTLAIIEFSNITLHDGENSPVILKVIAENGRERDYTINIYRLSEEESNKVFNRIVIEGYNIDFDKNKYTYNLNIDSSVNSLNISVDPSDIRANIVGNENLKDGSVIVVQINDANGSNNYTFNIFKDMSEKKDSYVLPIIVFVFGLLSFGASICYYVKVNKKS